MELQRELHPEFGYFCPTEKLRRRVRIAMLTAAVGALVSAVAVLVSIARPDPDTQVSAMTADRVGAAVPEQSGPAATRAPALVRTNRPCQAQTWPYLERKCLRGASRAVRHVDRAPDGRATGPRGDTLTEAAKAAQAYALAPAPKNAANPAAERKRASRHRSRPYGRERYDQAAAPSRRMYYSRGW